MSAMTSEQFWDDAYENLVEGRGSREKAEGLERAIGLKRAAIGAQTNDEWEVLRERLRQSMEADLRSLAQGLEMRMDKMRFLQGRIFVYESILTDKDRLQQEVVDLQLQLDELSSRREDHVLEKPLQQGSNP